MFTQFDIIVSVICLFFVILGFFNGAIRTVFLLGKWVGAWYITNLFYPQATDFVGQVVQPGMMVNVIATIGLFLISLVAIAIVGSLLSATISGTIGGWLDKALGIGFGLVQGFAVASVIHYCAVMFNSGKPPAWLQDGQTFEYTQAGANYFDKVLKNKMNDANFAFDKSKMPSFNFSSLSDELGFDVAKSVPRSKKDDVDVSSLGAKLLEMKSDGMKPADIQKLVGQENFIDQFVGIANGMKPGGDAGAAVQNLKSPIGGDSGGSLMDSFLGKGSEGTSNKIKLKEFKIEDSSKAGFEGESLEEVQ
jgi:membrane protein required for colicin V production